MGIRTETRGWAERSEQFLKFSTMAEARSFLFGLYGDPANIHTLRQVILEDRLSGTRAPRMLHDHEVVDQAARALTTGRIRISEVLRRPAGVCGNPPVEEAEEVESSARAAPVDVPTHWIDIELLDEDDEPVQGALYEITFPNGKVEHGRLDTEGQAKYSKLQYEGECTVRFPEYDQGAVAAVSGRRKAPTHWLELEFVDEDNQPVPDAAYQVEFPDGRVEQGELDSKGLARFTELQKGGDCTVTFPEFDQSALVKA